MVFCILRPQWEIRLRGGQVMRPRLWLWQEPDLRLVTALTSEVHYLEMFLSATGMLVCTYFWWWLGGVQRKATSEASYG